MFTVLTVCAAAILLRRPGAVTLADLQSGLSFELPAAGLATAIAVFGITGVGATELVMYPYWCVEKGYARFVGERDGSAAWVSRARGWIRVMHLDITCSLAIYTMATVAFYLLGAGVLNRMGLVPAERDTITVLSNIYTQTLGAWALWLFYLGAVVTLYGTVFASTAAHARLFADAVRIAGWYPREDAESRRRWRNRFVVVLSVVPVTFYWFLKSPVQMVIAGGVAQALDAAAHRRRGHLPAPHAAAGRDTSDDRHDAAALDLERRDAGVCVLLRVVADVSVSFQLSALSSQLSAIRRTVALSVARLSSEWLLA